MNLIFNVRYPMSAEEFRCWRTRMELTRYQAGLLLDLSERMISYYESGARDVPYSAYINCMAYENWPALNARLGMILASRQQVKRCT